MKYPKTNICVLLVLYLNYNSNIDKFKILPNKSLKNRTKLQESYAPAHDYKS